MEVKCKNCRGTGERHTINWETGKVYIVQGEKCPVCGGKGDIEQTNEEWFCRLPTDEKAEFLDNIPYSDLYDQYDRMDWENWLKEKHKEGEA